jgi:hypothetical protein
VSHLALLSWPGIDPAIHLKRDRVQYYLDGRVKPGHDNRIFKTFVSTYAPSLGTARAVQRACMRAEPL